MRTDYEIKDYEIGDGQTWSITGKAVFDVEAESYPAEPFSWGGFRGIEVDAHATLAAFVVGKLVLTRDQIVTLYGERDVGLLEKAAAEEWATLYEAGEFA